ncbi:hypothetical protein ALC57_11006, partial [Trachymyrmex cornetzi]
YAEVMRTAREKVDIDAMGIHDLRPRKSRTGALLLEIPGAESSTKADKLAEKLQQALEGQKDVLVSRPEKMADIRMKDLEESTTKEDIILALTLHGSCSDKVLKLGEIIPSNNGLGTMWIRCPLAVAKKITKSRRIRVGWAMVRVDLLPERTSQCYKCLEPGHVRLHCKSEIDRGALCYRCGKSGHMAKDCSEVAHCVICASRNLKADHRMGGPACKPPVIKGRNRKELRSSGRELPQNSTKNKESLKMEVDIPQTQISTEERKEREVSVTREFAKCSVKEGDKPENARIVEEMDVEEIKIENVCSIQKPQASMEWPDLGHEWSMSTQGVSRKEGNGEGGLQHKDQNNDQ